MLGPFMMPGIIDSPGAPPQAQIVRVRCPVEEARQTHSADTRCKSKGCENSRLFLLFLHREYETTPRRRLEKYGAGMDARHASQIHGRRETVGYAKAVHYTLDGDGGCGRVRHVPGDIGAAHGTPHRRREAEKTGETHRVLARQTRLDARPQLL